ncbi:hypothetical protein C4J81_18505 [Deltaproteobacteria bacterium Smac51]|nr:hypothetical protein C4J81_18505 [Deltaproteobacteria bacterium Smac51]
MSGIYVKFSRLVEPLADRPLISLLPFYIAGIIYGWEVGGGAYFTPLAWCVVCAAAALVVSFFRFKYLIIFKIIAAFLLGCGLTSRTLTEPSDPRHLINFATEERFADHVVLGGVVVETVKRTDSRYQRLIIDGRELVRPGYDGPDEFLAVSGRARIDVTDGAFVRPGDYVRLPVVIRRMSGFRNPGGLNPEKLWAAQGVWVKGYVREPRLISSWPNYGDPGLMVPVRERSTEFLYEKAPYPAAGLLASMLLGRRSDVDSNSDTVFRNLGLSHILAVSGLHLGLWYGLCLWLSLIFLRRILPRFALTFAPGMWKKLGFSSRGGLYSGRIIILASVMALGPALFYAALVGGASPVIRATIMVTAVALAILARRGADSWNIIAAAAWVLLLAEPYRLFQASFQMSFVATLAMVAVFHSRPGRREKAADKKVPSIWNTPITAGFLKAILKRDKEALQDEWEWPNRPQSFFRQLLLASLAGAFSTAPLVIWHFSWLPAAGIPGNLIFSPLISVFVLIPGLLSLMALPFSEIIAGMLMDFSSSVLMFLMPVMEGASNIAGPGYLLPIPGKLFLAAYFLAGWLWLRSPRSVKTRLLWCCLILTAGLMPYLLKGQGDRGILRFTVLDVGQGASIHINFPDQRQMVIDGGGSPFFDPGERLVTSYLLRQGIYKLDYAALTHPDEDHLKGLISLCRNFRPDEIWENPWPATISPLYEEFLHSTAGTERADLSDLARGWLIGPVSVEMLWPEAEYDWPPVAPKGNWANNMGMVFKIAWGEVSFLVTGDIEKKTERRLVEMYGSKLASTVLVAPHHGSATSMTPDFMAAVKPEFVVFSAGRNNYFDHPNIRSLERAKEGGAVIWRTDHQGAAVFEVREKGEGIDLKLLPPL